MIGGQPTHGKDHHMTKYLCYFRFLVKDLTVHELPSCKKDQQVTNVKEVPQKISEEQWDHEVTLALHLGVLCLVSNKKQETDLQVTWLQ
jgi:hypothetical protein